MEVLCGCFLRNLVVFLVVIQACLNVVTPAKKYKGCYLKVRNAKYVLLCGEEAGAPSSKDQSERSVITRKDRKVKRGPQGPEGPPGPPGLNGKDGISGATGPMGPMGPAGVPGRRGPIGPKGLKGEKGNQGPQGGQGPAGVPGNCIKDSPMEKEIEEKLYHCLPGPMGPQGVQGERGEKGEMGEAGPQGIQGPPGQKGEQGRRGPVGMPGIPGAVGRVVCETHYTEWQGNFSHLDSKSFDGFFCPSGHFLQGFKIEKDGIKERYNYVCCKIT